MFIMINSEHFHPAPTSFEQFFEYMAGVKLYQVQELAKLDNDIGVRNRERLNFWIKTWDRYCNLTGRQQEIVLKESNAHI